MVYGMLASAGLFNTKSNFLQPIMWFLVTNYKHLEIESAFLDQIQDQTICVSLRTNTIEKSEKT